MSNATPTQAKINSLFIQLEAETKASNHFNNQSLYSENPSVSREAYGRVFEETLQTISQIQKRIVRALFKTGQSGIGEIEALIEVGTLPRFAIQAALNRI